jgi:hypothetical protein
MTAGSSLLPQTGLLGPRRNVLGAFLLASPRRGPRPPQHSEVVCCDERGLATFQLLRHRRNEPQAFLYAFDLLELDGTDFRRETIEVRKATLASILCKSRHGVRLNEHLERRRLKGALPLLRDVARLSSLALHARALGGRIPVTLGCGWPHGQ